MMTKLGWYWRRLRLMSGRELWHRVAELYHVQVLRLITLFPVLGKLKTRSTPAHRFVFCGATSPQLSLPARRRAFSKGEIDDLLAGRIMALGCPWQWDGSDAAWHRAPDSGKIWPLRFFASIPYRPGNPYGDVRIAWEPSRLQQLVALGLVAAKAQGETRASAIDQIESQLLSWLSANPPYRGIHYLSAMECALRVIAVCHALDLVRHELRRASETWPALVALMDSHARLIEGRLSLYSSAGNHTIAECVGLLYAGTLFPELARARHWYRIALSLLPSEAQRQVLPDGGSLEQAPAYHLFVIDLLGLAIALLTRHGRNIPDALRDAYARGLQYLTRVASSPFHLPAFGDRDDGYAISSLLGVNWQTPPPDTPQTLTHPDTGHTIVRHPSPRDMELLFDHGPLGMPPGCGHGHADALSVQLSLQGVPVLIDPGTYTYNGQQNWRQYFRGTRAHNTVCVDQLDQAVQRGAFLWAQPYHAHLLRSEPSDTGRVRLLGRHDGYVQRLEVIHQRAISVPSPQCWLIWDRLDGPGAHVLELNWHFLSAPQSTENGWCVHAGKVPVYVKISGGTTSLASQELDPIRGWYAPRYGQRQAAYSLSTQYQGQLPHEFLTVLIVGDENVDMQSIQNELQVFRQWTE